MVVAKQSLVVTDDFLEEFERVGISFELGHVAGKRKVEVDVDRTGVFPSAELDKLETALEKYLTSLED